MSTETVIRCDACKLELREHKEPFVIRITTRTSVNIWGEEKTYHACSDQCFRAMMVKLTPAADQTVSKGVYR